MAKNNIENSYRKNILIGKNIRKLITHRGISLHQLGKSTGISFTTIRRIVEDEESNPTLASLEAIANYFEVSVSALLGESTNEINSPILLKRKTYKLVPLIEYEDVDLWPENKDVKLHSETIKSVSTDSDVSDDAFALIANDSSMEPAILHQSILIVDPHHAIYNKCFIVLIKKNAKIPQIKQILLDGPYKYLKTLNPEISQSASILLDEEQYKIRGVIREIITKC